MTLTRNYEQVGYKDLSGFFRYSTKPREVASVMDLGHLLYPALWKDHGDDIFTRLLGDLIRYQIKSIMTGHILSIMTNRKISNINSKSDFYYATDGRYIHCRNLRQEWIKTSTDWTDEVLVGKIEIGLKGTGSDSGYSKTLTAYYLPAHTLRYVGLTGENNVPLRVYIEKTIIDPFWKDFILAEEFEKITEPKLRLEHGDADYERVKARETWIGMTEDELILSQGSAWTEHKKVISEECPVELGCVIYTYLTETKEKQFIIKNGTLCTISDTDLKPEG